MVRKRYGVSLRRRFSDSHFCGGSVITESWIITAAHCLYLNGMPIEAWTILVVGGELLLNTTTSTGQRSGVTTMMIHQNFDNSTLENDVALLKLETPFVFNTTALKPRPLQTSSVSPGTMCQVAGWGYPAFDISVVSNELLYVNLPLLHQTLCRQLLKNYSDVPDGMLCAGYLEGGKDACKGDSGGGMICNNVLTGIVSGGIGCAWPKTPGIYTDVKFYRSWISEMMKNSTENDNKNVTIVVSSTSNSARPGDEASGAIPTMWAFFLLLSTLVLLLNDTDLHLE
ncbi:trypsin-2 isoform X2 [Cephus cinctus]|uniref:Trypsin-2 isoform X2 n=1 Tax=Cephus cinctus TaxID=211228 RepID=A0AAJ7BWP0_CEPCN|nr:trypsin-2 isoform X2 [Cephus cinctus]